MKTRTQLEKEIIEEFEKMWREYCQKNSIPALHRISIGDLMLSFLSQTITRTVEAVMEAGRVERQYVELDTSNDDEIEKIGFNTAIRQVEKQLSEFNK